MFQCFMTKNDVQLLSSQLSHSMCVSATVCIHNLRLHQLTIFKFCVTVCVHIVYRSQKVPTILYTLHMWLLIWWTRNSIIALHFNMVEYGSISVCYTARYWLWMPINTFKHCMPVTTIASHQISILPCVIPQFSCSNTFLLYKQHSDNFIAICTNQLQYKDYFSPEKGPGCTNYNRLHEINCMIYDFILFTEFP